MKDTTKYGTTKPTLHRDGTVTYWSVRNQAWKKRVTHIPDHDYAAMDNDERDAILRHLKVE